MAARFYSQEFSLASNASAGMYGAKMLTIVACKSLNLLENAIIFEVTGKQAKRSGVLVYMSGISNKSAKTDVKAAEHLRPSGKVIDRGAAKK